MLHELLLLLLLVWASLVIAGLTVGRAANVLLHHHLLLHLVMHADAVGRVLLLDWLLRWRVLLLLLLDRGEAQLRLRHEGHLAQDCIALVVGTADGEVVGVLLLLVCSLSGGHLLLLLLRGLVVERLLLGHVLLRILLLRSGGTLAEVISLLLLLLIVACVTVDSGCSTSSRVRLVGARSGGLRREHRQDVLAFIVAGLSVHERVHLGLVDGRRLTCVLLLHELLLRLHDRCILLPTDEGPLDRSVRAVLTSADELWIHQATNDLLL